MVEAACGDTIMVNPGEMHDGAPVDGKPRGWRMLFFEPSIVQGIFPDDDLARTPTVRPAVHDPAQYLRVRSLFDAMIAAHPDRLRIDECLVSTLAYALRHHSSRHSRCLPAWPDVGRVVKLIDEQPELPLSLQQMASAVGVSRFHFLRGFARSTGATPHAYVVQRRVRLARRLLAAGSDIAAASVEAGFADQSHMSRAFVRQLGMPPARYRATVYKPRGRAISFKTIN